VSKAEHTIVICPQKSKVVSKFDVITISGEESHRERGPVQRDQHTIETIAAQHEDGQDAQGPQELAERGLVPDQRDVQTAASEEHIAHVPHTVRAYFQVSEQYAPNTSA